MKLSICGLVVVLLALGSTAQAITVDYLARSSNILDLSDAGEDFGSSGHWFPNFDRDTNDSVDNAAPTDHAADALPSYATLSFPAGVDSAGGYAGDNILTLPDGTTGLSGALEINNPPGTAGATLEYTTVTFGADVPRTLFLEVLVDNTASTNFGNVQVLANGSSSVALSNNSTADILIYWLQDILPGDTVTIEGVTSTTQVTHLGGIMFDEIGILEVNTTVGVGRMLGSGVDREFLAYTVQSAGDLINLGGWNSLQDQGFDSGSWFEQIATTGEIQEVNGFGTTTFGPNGQDWVSLGEFYSGSDPESDISFFATDIRPDGEVRSFPGAVIEITSPKGDMNLDGVLDDADVNPFVQALTDPAAYEARYGIAPALVIADMNSDGFFNLGDVADFKLAISGPGNGSATSVPEPTSMSLFLLAAVAMIGRRRRR